MSMSMTVLMTVAVLFVLALAGYAAVLLLKLRRQKQRLAQQDALFQQKKIEHEDYLVQSIQVIADNVVQGDLNLSEASIRLKFLLDGLGLSDQERARFIAFDELYHKVKDFDTHQDRKALSVKERQLQDNAREAHEAEHRATLVLKARELIGYDFSAFGSAGGKSGRS
ncbi:MAG: DUF2489 domain-containing protein [Natronospirillum sp.]